MQAALEAFARLGLDPDEICRRADLDRRSLSDPASRVPLEVGNRMWAGADALWGRPGLGLHAGARVPFGAYSALDYLLVTAESMEEGIAALTRYFRIVTEGATRLELFDEPRGIGLSFAGTVPLQIRDYALSLVAGRVRRIGGQILDARVAGPLLGESREYARAWGVAPSAGQPASALVIARTASGAAASDYPGLREIVEREAQRLLGDLEGDRELADARAAVVALLPQGRPRLGDVAVRLHASPRTVQRRLREHGWSFAALVDAVRAELARQYLEERRLSVAEVGYLLGFAEPASFTRACARWFGSSPARMRGRRA